jgi:hypothetical protein
MDMSTEKTLKSVDELIEAAKDVQFWTEHGWHSDTHLATAIAKLGALKEQVVNDLTADDSDGFR